ncbi:hypothetical protein [Leptothoe sp. PORK10 BA2]|uniref:hypothetical protein n=1 Tax=Leptothoe sp. PORK10 BA2 TaxID=3110254 RepID=UPI002B215B9A|nr:hypothetical protein [Leptothoe sp. PORK10 BA2]MEA5464709.1 hypothetical protein [Leptothoe sp. PORK10 BA2]
MKQARWLKQLTHWLMVVMVTAGLVGCWPSGSDVVNANPGDDMDKIKVTISLDDAHLDQIDQVSEQLKAAGLEVEQTLSTLGIVTGLVESEKMSSLSEVTGVESVEVDQTIRPLAKMIMC